jgi:hypothetical protein
MKKSLASITLALGMTVSSVATFASPALADNSGNGWKITSVTRVQPHLCEYRAVYYVNGWQTGSEKIWEAYC